MAGIFMVLSALLLSAGPVPHAIYLSVIEVDRKDLAIPAVIKIKVFANDMEDALANQSGTRKKLIDQAGCLKAKAEIEGYFHSYFSFKVNEVSVKLELAHCELIGDALWFYFQTNETSAWQTVTVTATYLMELFPTQSNVLSIYYGQEKKFARLTKAQPTLAFKFQH